jgi:hypothetical protein
MYPTLHESARFSRGMTLKEIDNKIYFEAYWGSVD